MFTSAFWRDAFERAVKTGVQAVLLFLGADAALDAVSVDWASAGSFFLGGFVLSVLTSVASAPLGDRGTPSLVKAKSAPVPDPEAGE